MAYINVDRGKIDSSADAVDNYISEMKKEMSYANNDVKVLSSTWQGGDFTEFKNQWDGVTKKDSAYSQMVKALDSYSSYLQIASRLYKIAQDNAIRRANSLPH